jgi:hypothetical protein
MDNISKPEKAPVNKGVPIYDIAIENVKSVSNVSNEKKEMTLKLLEARYNFGKMKYGQPLMSEDGRDDVEDCLQEIGDAIQYLSKAIYHKKDITPIRHTVEILYQIANKK